MSQSPSVDVISAIRDDSCVKTPSGLEQQSEEGDALSNAQDDAGHAYASMVTNKHLNLAGSKRSSDDTVLELEKTTTGTETGIFKSVCTSDGGVSSHSVAKVVEPTREDSDGEDGEEVYYGEEVYVYKDGLRILAQGTREIVKFEDLF